MPKGSRRTCSKEGCDRPHLARGLCNRHYKRLPCVRDKNRARELTEKSRARRRELYRARIESDPGFRRRRREKATNRRRERYQSDQEFREKVKAAQRCRNKHGAGYRKWRGTLLMEQGFACALCGKTMAGTPDVDHVVPISKGGGDEKTNLQVTCPTCNRRKGNRT